ncbi:MAG: hypothetical protein JST04_11920 [Bdellovibrionales bacterium]|nr:hypothetical protein [Bdellovibrionales bacterium]
MKPTLLAGAFFALLGLVGTLDYDVPNESRAARGRGIASLGDCDTAECRDLLRIEKAILESPAPATESTRAAKADAASRDAKNLVQAAATFSKIFRGRDATENELDETARFLVATYSRDPAGVVFDGMSGSLGDERTNTALGQVKARILKLAAEGVLGQAAADAAVTFIDAFLDPSPAPAK